jgi:hypothetical protein
MRTMKGMGKRNRHKRDGGYRAAGRLTRHSKKVKKAAKAKEAGRWE